MTMTVTDQLISKILSLPEGDELSFARYVVCRIDPCCWKAHIFGTAPDCTGEFLDSEADVRAWVREVLQ
jgi:hypothetical protein